MMATIGLGVKLPEVLRGSRDYGPGRARCTGNYILAAAAARGLLRSHTSPITAIGLLVAESSATSRFCCSIADFYRGARYPVEDQPGQN